MHVRPAFHHKRSPTYKDFATLVAGLGGVSGAGRVVYTDSIGNLKTEAGFEYNETLNVLSVGGDIRAGSGTFVGGIPQYYKDVNIGTVLTSAIGSVSDFFIASRDGGAGFRIMSNTRNIQLGNDKVAIDGTTGHLTWLADNVSDIGSVGANRPRTGYFGSFLIVGTLQGTSHALRVNGATGGVLYANSATLDATSNSTNWLRSPKNTVTCFVGDNDVVSGYLANEFSGGIRFNGSGVAWGDFGYYPQGGNSGVFRFHTTGANFGGANPNASIGAGWILVSAGSAASPTHSFYNSPTSGLYQIANAVRTTILGTDEFEVFTNRIKLPSGSVFGWTSGGVGSTQDTILGRDAANTLALRNGVNPQIFNIYNTFTDLLNFERLSVRWSGNNAFVLTENAGTGVARDLKVRSASVVYLESQNGTWQAFLSGGTFGPGGNNTQDLGIAASNKWRNGYFGTSVQIGVIDAGATPGNQGLLRVFGNTAVDRAPILSLYRTGAKEGIIAIGSNGTLIFGNTGGLANYQDATIDAAAQWLINTDGHFAPALDNNYDFGTSGLRIRTGYFANNVKVANGFYDSDTTHYFRQGANDILRLIHIGVGTGIELASVDTTGSISFEPFLITGEGITLVGKTAPLQFNTNSTPRIQISHTGQLLWNTDNTLDIGASGANRPKTGYFGTQVISNGAVGGGANSSFYAASNSPFYGINDNDAGVNEKRWDLGASSTVLTLRTVLDDDSNANTVYQVTRSGLTVAQHSFWGGATQGEQLRITPISAAVNYFDIRGGVTGGSPILRTTGSDTDIVARYRTKGAGNHTFETNDTQDTIQFQILHTASANRRITVTGSNGGNPTLATSAGDLAITPNTVIAGNLTVNGNSNLGDSTTDVATSKGRHDSGMGTGSGVMILAGKANINTTPVANVGTGEDDLITYSLPANSLSSAGKGVRITAWGINANNAAAKTLKLYFGSVAILTFVLGVNTAGVWRIDALVFSTGTDAQRYQARGLNTTNLATAGLSGTLTQDDGAAITIKCTGTATNNNDITQEGLLVEFFN